MVYRQTAPRNWLSEVKAAMLGDAFAPAKPKLRRWGHLSAASSVLLAPRTCTRRLPIALWRALCAGLVHRDAPAPGLRSSSPMPHASAAQGTAAAGDLAAAALLCCVPLGACQHPAPSPGMGRCHTQWWLQAGVAGPTGCACRRAPICVRVYRDIPVPTWRIVFPDKLLQFRPLDGLRSDLFTVAGARLPRCQQAARCCSSLCCSGQRGSLRRLGRPWVTSNRLAPATAGRHELDAATNADASPAAVVPPPWQGWGRAPAAGSPA